jgi:hypothetical protein
MTHREHASQVRPAQPCTCHHLTYGGRCLNCGYDPTGTTPPTPPPPQNETKWRKLTWSERLWKE